MSEKRFFLRQFFLYYFMLMIVVESDFLGSTLLSAYAQTTINKHIDLEECNKENSNLKARIEIFEKLCLNKKTNEEIFEEADNEAQKNHARRAQLESIKSEQK